jgi:predicted nucleic acid-binding protein
LIIAAAQESGCSLLYTEDLSSGQKIKDLQIKNPFTLEMIEKNQEQGSKGK